MYWLVFLFLLGCEIRDERCEATGLYDREVCHNQVYRDCLRNHRKAGLIILNEDLEITEAGKNRMWLADCIIKEHECRDHFYWDVCRPDVPRHKQSRFSDTGWTKETFFAPEVREAPAIKKRKKEDRKRFWGD